MLITFKTQHFYIGHIFLTFFYKKENSSILRGEEFSKLAIN